MSAFKGHSQNRLPRIPTHFSSECPPGIRWTFGIFKRLLLQCHVLHIFLNGAIFLCTSDRIDRFFLRSLKSITYYVVYQIFLSQKNQFLALIHYYSGKIWKSLKNIGKKHDLLLNRAVLPASSVYMKSGRSLRKRLCKSRPVSISSLFHILQFQNTRVILNPLFFARKMQTIFVIVQAEEWSAICGKNVTTRAAAGKRSMKVWEAMRW